MDFNEASLKERFETAVGGASPDVGALMDGGVERGEQLRRRRRAQGLGAAGISAAAVAVLAYAGFGHGLFDFHAIGPSDAPSSVVQTVTEPATPRSLAAIALEHLPDEQVVGAGTMGDAPQRSTVFASVGLDTNQGKVQLDLIASRQVKQWDKEPPCAASSPGLEVVQCDVSTLADGSQLVQVAQRSDAGPRPSSYLVLVGVRRDDHIVGALEYLAAQQVAPQEESLPVAEWTLPVSVSTLREIVTDPRFGVLTSPEMIAEGDALDNFTEDGMTGSSSGGSAVQVSPPEATGVQVGPGRPARGVASTSAPEQPGETDSSSGP